jgi:hypothetical protein
MFDCHPADRVLLALVPLAIQASREAAWRTECGNNLRQIVAGLASYHDAHKMFPMGALHSGPNPGGDPPVTARLGPSWWFGILPLPGCSENHGINNPLQSPHPGGLLAGMADGSVRFIRETTDLEVLLRLSIRDDGVSPPPP